MHTGQNTVLGNTVTPELRRRQAEMIARTRQSGALLLALRSLVDAKTVENATDDQTPKRGGSISVVPNGVRSAKTTQK
jgi:Flp pilus assembly protein CpaB